MEACLNKETIRLGLHAENLHDAISQAAEPLIRQRKILPGYVDQMVDAVRELGPYMVILPGIALAHGRPSENVLEECISLATFRTPVIFGSEENDPVHAVFVLASPKSSGHLDILRDISRLLSEENFLKILQSTSDVDELTDYIEKEKEKWQK